MSLSVNYKIIKKLIRLKVERNSSSSLFDTFSLVISVLSVIIAEVILSRPTKHRSHPSAEIVWLFVPASLAEWILGHHLLVHLFVMVHHLRVVTVERISKARLIRKA